MQIASNEYLIDVVVHFDANENRTTVNLPSFQYLERIYLLEYNVVTPNGGSVTPSVMRLNLSGMFPDAQKTNLAGSGYAVNISNSVATHVTYDTPRLVSNRGRDYFSLMECTLEAVTKTTAVPAQFDAATFNFVFVCRNPHWNPAEVTRLTLADPEGQRLAFGTRGNWQ